MRKHVDVTGSAVEAARTKRREAASERLRAIQTSVVQQLEDRNEIAVHSVEADIATDE